MATGLPRTLRRAGFRVAVLGRRDSLIRRSDHVDRFFGYSFHALRYLTVLGAIRSWRPDILVPCDDDSIELLCRIGRDLASRRPYLVPDSVRGVLRRSIGPVDAYATKFDRLAALETMRRAGIRTPPFAPAASFEDVRAFGDLHGFPVVLKIDSTAAGTGVRVCSTAAEAEDGFRELERLAVPEGRSHGRGLLVERLLYGSEARRRARMHVQGFIRGREAMRLFLASEGRELCGVSASKVVRSNNGLGPATVVEFIDHPEMAGASRKLAEGLSYGGLGSVDFVVEEGSGHAYAIELNARLTALVHLGPIAGVDFGLRWHYELRGVQTSGSGRETRNGSHPRNGYRAGGRVALFPREWLRDPESPHLRECFVDVPIDDPGLLAATLDHARRAAPEHRAFDLRAVQTDPFAAARRISPSG